MSFMRKISIVLARFMAGRNGPDQLGIASLWTGLACSLIGSFSGIGIFSLAGTALYVYSVFRLLSRNTYRRAEENRKFVQLKNRVTTEIRQFIMRVRNSRQYKYFYCPQCKVRLRLTRGCGEKTVHCPKCKFEFRQKA